jgi:ubiquinone/menaquinone biosynthesis C-methylase UbiE
MSKYDLPRYASSAYAGYMSGERYLEKQLALSINFIRSTLSARTIIDDINPPLNANVLEVGIGVGDLANALKRGRNDLNVFGFDISLPALTLNEEKRHISCVADLKWMPFKSDAFDLTYSTDVYEHEQDAGQAMRELFRVTKPGGYIMHAIADPSEARFWKVRDHKHRETDDSHVLFWESQIEKTGFILMREKNAEIRKRDWRRIIRESPIPFVKMLSETRGFATVLNKFHRPGLYIAFKPIQ